MFRNPDLKNWILFEDDNYLVVNKPPFVATLDDRSSPNNMLTLARSYCAEVQVCHRLDKETSGALLFAKNANAYRFAAMQFEKRTVGKTYHAVVEGVHEFRNTKVNAALQVTGNGKVMINPKQGKEATTYFSTLAIYNSYSLVECRPETGRMHQIRVHLASLKAPIVNDQWYGGNPFYLSSIKRKYNLKKDTDEKPLIQRFALHAYAISLEGLDGNSVQIEAPYPKDYKVLLHQLKKNN